MRIVLIEPYYGGSHRAWADGFKRFSRHDVTLLTMPAQFWKWRMQGGAVTMARMFQDLSPEPELILITDMLNMATFRALTRTEVPIALYFHENQLSYPQNKRQRHGWQYGFVNYISALAADAVFFNSAYHYHEFLRFLPRLLKHFADYNELESIDDIRRKSAVLPLAVDLRRFDAYRIERTDDGPPLIVWNHRWEEDKNPDVFLGALDRLMADQIDFRVAIVGENTRQQFPEFEAMRDRLGERLVQYGYLPDFADYARLLWSADYVVSAADQEFFGIAIAEGMYCGCVPLVPRRLNYPYLIPEALHGLCLYPENKLAGLLRHHLMTSPQVEPNAIRQHVMSHDWTALIDRYDDTFERLAANSR